MSKIYWILFVFIFISAPMRAQIQDLSDKPMVWKGNLIDADSKNNSLLNAFKKGKLNGRFRYFFMATDNAPGLTDYFANALGAGLRYETASFHGFQMAMSTYFVFNIGSSDLGKPDPTTKQLNRYELGLFDLENPYNKSNIGRIEELCLKYTYKKSNIIVGKQYISTPFINLQDGRMQPTAVEGINFTINEIKKLRIDGGWLYRISPRGSNRWFDIDKSFGLYPGGVNTNGQKSNYVGNLKSAGLFNLAIHYEPVKFLQIHAWDLYAQNIFNSAMLQADFKFVFKNSQSLYFSAQGVRQDAVNQGGNADQSKTYFEKGKHSYTFGGKLGWKNDHWDLSVNYNRITADARYLMPREWGRDPFFTFLPRERNEGLGDVHAMAAKIHYNVPKIRLKTSLAGAYCRLPDVKNYRLNKYGMPSYYQVNADVRYAFSGFLKGLDIQLLVVAKFNQGNTYNDNRFVFNRVNMMLYNLVLNYHF